MVFNVSSNRLTNIPTASLQQMLPALIDLDISSNAIGSLRSHDFEGMIELTALHLNRISMQNIAKYTVDYSQANSVI